jgi:hypothetical protein
MKDMIAESIDSGFAQHDGRGGGRAHAKVAEIAAGARCQAAPASRAGSAEFSSYRLLVLSAQQKDGIGVDVGIEHAGLDQGSD